MISKHTNAIGVRSHEVGVRGYEVGVMRRGEWESGVVGLHPGATALANMMIFRVIILIVRELASSDATFCKPRLYERSELDGGRAEPRN